MLALVLKYQGLTKVFLGLNPDLDVIEVQREEKARGLADNRDYTSVWSDTSNIARCSVGPEIKCRSLTN